MFDGCSRLSSLDVSGFDTSGVTDMTNMFNACTRLTGLDLSGFDTSKVTASDSFMPNSLGPNWRSLFAK